MRCALPPCGSLKAGDPPELAHYPVQEAGRCRDQGRRWRRFAALRRAVDETLGDIGPGAPAGRGWAEFGVPAVAVQRLHEEIMGEAQLHPAVAADAEDAERVEA